ncbi:hypothetical protein [Streptomyces sp. NPDC018833]|uniref:hypothetical protein n=1 Tax=Streptomyces sp. NPDC018833 TaxID=3365053 RepID=UPI0037B2CEE3
MFITTILALAPLGGYAALCAVQPFTRCGKCAGEGERERFGKTRTCPRCRGRGQHLRAGRRLHNAAQRTHDAGSR